MAIYKSIPLSAIHIGERARPVDEDHALAIAASMAERGLINPITVRATPARKGAPYTLVAGGHRLRAAELNAMQEIDAIVVEADAAEAQLMEISENLYRNELSALDRAVFVLKFREVWEEKNGAINPNGGRPRKQGNDCPVFFTGGRELSKQVRERLGFGERTYKYVNQIGKNLHPDLRNAIRGTDAERDQSKLLKLCRMPADEQIKAANALRERSDLAAVLSSLKRSIDAGPTGELARPKPEDAPFNRLLNAWERADEATRARFLAHIGVDSAALLEDAA